MIIKQLRFQDRVRIHILMFIFLIFLDSSCQNNKVKVDSSKKEVDNISKVLDTSYFKLIDSLDLKEEFDSAKWLIYEKQFQDTVQWNIPDKKSKVYTFGELQVELDNAVINKDTIDFNFCYSIPSKIDCKDFFIGNKCVINGVGVSLLTKQLLYYKTTCNFSVFIDSLFRRKMQEKRNLLINYINSNLKKLDPWFRSESVKRKI